VKRRNQLSTVNLPPSIRWDAVGWHGDLQRRAASTWREPAATEWSHRRPPAALGPHPPSWPAVFVVCTFVHAAASRATRRRLRPAVSFTTTTISTRSSSITRAASSAATTSIPAMMTVAPLGLHAWPPSQGLQRRGPKAGKTERPRRGVAVMIDTRDAIDVARPCRPGVEFDGYVKSWPPAGDEAGRRSRALQTPPTHFHIPLPRLGGRG